MTDEEELPDADFLRDLAERIFRIPVMYGVDQGDTDRLLRIAGTLPAQEIDLFGDVW